MALFAEVVVVIQKLRTSNALVPQILSVSTAMHVHYGPAMKKEEALDNC